MVNKILYYFSTDVIPFQFLQEFNKERLHELVSYDAFKKYLDNMWMSTGQMDSITVTNSSKLPQGITQMTTQMSYLDQDWIDELRDKTLNQLSSTEK